MSKLKKAIELWEKVRGKKITVVRNVYPQGRNG